MKRVGMSTSTQPTGSEVWSREVVGTLERGGNIPTQDKIE